MKIIELTKNSETINDKASNEPNILRQLQHRNLVEFVEDFKIPDSQTLCIVMEFIKGNTVEELI